jgi:hypothetical protein
VHAVGGGGGGLFPNCPPIKNTSYRNLYFGNSDQFGNEKKDLPAFFVYTSASHI